MTSDDLNSRFPVRSFTSNFIAQLLANPSAMGSFKPDLDGMNLSSDVLSLIERMLDMINDKDKKLYELQEKIDGLVKQEGQLKKTGHDMTSKMAELQQQVEDGLNEKKRLDKKVDDQHKQLAESRRLVAQLTSTQGQLQYKIDSLSTTIQSTVLRKLVDANRKGGKWSDFKRGLAKVLDQQGKAHQELAGIPKHHDDPLREVCSSGRLALLAVLLDAGLSTSSVVGNTGNTLLHEAVGNHHALQLLLDHGADVAARNTRGETPLVTATRVGNVASVRVLLARGANLDARDAEGRTALHLAAAAGHLDIFQLLVDAGADMTAKDAKNQTPLDCALSNGHDVKK